jgi:hypothetical protein
MTLAAIKKVIASVWLANTLPACHVMKLSTPTEATLVNRSKLPRAKQGLRDDTFKEGTTSKAPPSLIQELHMVFT